MNASGLNMLHDPHDVNIFPITNSINFGFVCPAKKMIDQYPVVWEVFENTQYVSFKFTVVDADTHSLSTQNIGRPNENRISHPIGDFNGFVHRVGDPIIGVWNTQLLEHI